MTLSTAQKNLIAGGVTLLFAVVVLLVRNAWPIRNDTPAPTTAPRASAPGQLSSPITLRLALIEATPESNIYSVMLDSHATSLSTLSLRFLLNNFAENEQSAIFIPNTLIQDKGWQVAINQFTDDRSTGVKSFDLALLNAQPRGGSSFTPDLPLGTLTLPVKTTFSLDDAMSKASATDATPYSFKLEEQQ